MGPLHNSTPPCSRPDRIISPVRPQPRGSLDGSHRLGPLGASSTGPATDHILYIEWKDFCCGILGRHSCGSGHLSRFLSSSPVPHSSGIPPLAGGPGELDFALRRPDDVRAHAGCRANGERHRTRTPISPCLLWWSPAIVHAQYSIFTQSICNSEATEGVAWRLLLSPIACA